MATQLEAITDLLVSNQIYYRYMSSQAHPNASTIIGEDGWIMLFNADGDLLDIKDDVMTPKSQLGRPLNVCGNLYDDFAEFFLCLGLSYRESTDPQTTMKKIDIGNYEIEFSYSGYTIHSIQSLNGCRSYSVVPQQSSPNTAFNSAQVGYVGNQPILGFPSLGNTPPIGELPEFKLEVKAADRCECGSGVHTRSPFHSSWCQLYQKD